ncbi:Predicted Zn-dependent peptidase [Mariniphaga anaerophila]|uniref:Predicted Zn-dependent peptidase n=1 Tax=Mariniphaga anaerophila TaxID=1484053 RepID=A0A1M4VNN2_9BACT|nr:M16 family metallopeptidase [Mariniphaga anaerophila]SHE70569.1 Predicted Zn-dependent peptidase [Mariniphaga anaerophila]
MKKTTVLFLFSLFCLFSNSLFSQEFKTYKLDNGLTVYLWPDSNQPDVTGVVAVRAGSIDEPAEYTGLAHYLEHVLFKGTHKIGALDWEKEKPHYDQIIKLYDEYAEATDPAVRVELETKINEESLLAAQYANTSEFSNLVEGMGGEGLNAGTSYDMTFYYNNFPTFQLEKWLDLYSERMINPIFRSFQAELENVFEEYNMYQDNNNTHISQFLFSNLYKGHPYERDIIGTSDDLKNPRLSKLIEFYNTWYVPSNMALILVGNFDAESAKPLIEEKFGRLETKEIPERPSYPETDFSGNPTHKAKLGYSPSVIWGYKGVPVGHQDELLLDFCASLLSNSMNTGLLDKVTLDGDVQYAGASVDSRRDQGRFLIQAVPYYDANQRRYDSDKATEKIVMEQVNKLKAGDIEDWLIESVKNAELRNYELTMENPTSKVAMLRMMFIYNLPLDYFTKMPEKIKAITKADIQQIAKKYIDAGHLTVSIEVGTPKKNKLKKPDIKPIEQPKGKTSAYAEYLKAIPVKPVPEIYNDFADVKTVNLYDKVKLHCSENPMNDYFSVTLKYGVGTKKMPKLKYATSLMNSAGIMPDMDAQSVRREFSKLNATCTYRVTDDYFYINLLGLESNLEEICQLMTRQTLMPKLDEKQLNRVAGNEISSRLMFEAKSADILGNALLEYALYEKESDYIDRLTLEEVFYLTISELTGEIIRATDYTLDIHYVGKRPAAEITEVLKANLPLKEGVKDSESPVIQDRVKYDKQTIYFLPNSDVQQAKIYFYVEGFDYNIADEVEIDAFNQYFSGGFNGLVMNEIRENNSMAYTAVGYVSTPPVQNKNTYFLGYVGTQPDKVADAVDLYMELLKKMPLHPERIDNIKTYLKQSALTTKPTFRLKSQRFADWEKLGYTDDPAKVNMEKINNLTFEQIQNFYEQKIKDKPITIIITGDRKLIDTKQIEQNHGKIRRVNAKQLFSAE